MMPLGDEPDRLANGAARMAGAILEFTHWPSPPPVVRLCVAGATRHAGRLDRVVLSSGVPLRVSALAPNGLPAQCDALYFGGLDLAASRRLIAGARDSAIVTIAEDDADCRSGAMFCLIFAPDALSFQLNIDAVSRSAVRIDPRVLRMSKGGY